MNIRVDENMQTSLEEVISKRTAETTSPQIFTSIHDLDESGQKQK